MKKVKIYGTLGPACGSEEILKRMFEEGMDGIRLNLSHMTLDEAADLVGAYHAAADAYGSCEEKRVARPELLIDMQGPELRIGDLDAPFELAARELVEPDSIPLPGEVLEFIASAHSGIDILLDDGKILLRTELTQSGLDIPGGFGVKMRVIRGGILESRKNVAVLGLDVHTPAMTEADLANISKAKDYGVTGLMQPFVRGKDDLIEVRKALDEAGLEEVRLFAKIENLDGVAKLDEIIPFCDEIIIARGDLGNAMDLWELPAVQKKIAAACREAGRDSWS